MLLVTIEIRAEGEVVHGKAVNALVEVLFADTPQEKVSIVLKRIDPAVNAPAIEVALVSIDKERIALLDVAHAEVSHSKDLAVVS